MRLSVRKILEKLKSLCSLSRLYVASWEGAGETASSTRDQGRALSTENEAGTREILDSTGQDSSEDARQSWHDEGRPDTFASVVKDRSASRRRQASTSTSDRIVLNLLDLRLVRRCPGPRNCIPPDGLCRYNQHALCVLLCCWCVCCVGVCVCGVLVCWCVCVDVCVCVLVCVCVFVLTVRGQPLAHTAS